MCLGGPSVFAEDPGVHWLDQLHAEDQDLDEDDFFSMQPQDMREVEALVLSQKSVLWQKGNDSPEESLTQTELEEQSDLGESVLLTHEEDGEAPLYPFYESNS